MSTQICTTLSCSIVFTQDDMNASIDSVPGSILHVLCTIMKIVGNMKTADEPQAVKLVTYEEN